MESNKKEFYCISFEGIDKSGKEIVKKYVDILGKHRYVLMDRGIISNRAYSRLYSRDYDYDVSIFKKWIFIYLTCDKDDWNIRCKLNNEAPINYDEHRHLFDREVMQMKQDGFIVLEYNTSEKTPYMIAMDILQNIDNLV